MEISAPDTGAFHLSPDYQLPKPRISHPSLPTGQWEVCLGPLQTPPSPSPFPPFPGPRPPRHRHGCIVTTENRSPNALITSIMQGSFSSFFIFLFLFILFYVLGVPPRESLPAIWQPLHVTCFYSVPPTSAVRDHVTSWSGVVAVCFLCSSRKWEIEQGGKTDHRPRSWLGIKAVY